jgi:hypothetical protein
MNHFSPPSRQERQGLRLKNPKHSSSLGALGQSCQFKHKEVIIVKLEPQMDANEREFSMSYKNP